MELLSKLGAAAEGVTVGYLGGVPDLDGREARSSSGFNGTAVGVSAGSRAELDNRAPLLIDAPRSAARCRVAYPKPPRRPGPDALTRDVLRASAATSGLRTVAQVAIGDGWSALRLRPL